MGNKETLQSYNAKLTSNNNSLEHILESINKLPDIENGEDSFASVNIFAKEEMPETFDGVWVKANTTINSVELITGVNPSLSWANNSRMPVSNREMGVTAIGTDIYMVGGGSYGSAVYKFNTLNNTYTRLTDLPYSAYGIAVVSYKTDLYIFGGRNGNNGTNYAYKYDTLTDTYTSLASMPYKSGQFSAVIKETDIYLVGGYDGSQLTTMYKYNILTNTYTKLKDLPSKRNASATVLYRNGIYILGGFNGDTLNELIRYNIETNTYTTLRNLPYKGFCIGAGLFDRYIIASGGNGEKDTVIYDIQTDTYTIAPSLSSGIGRTTGIVVGDHFYLVGGANGTTTTSLSYIQIAKIDSFFDYYENTKNTLLIDILNNASSLIKIMSTDDIEIKTNISNAYYYEPEAGVDYTIPIFIGDGEKWNSLR